MNYLLTSRSVGQTIAIGRRVGSLLRPGDFLALTGELGAGKTHFAKGVAEGIGVDNSIPVTSPTYTILNVYAGRFPLYHFDLYRLDGEEDVENLGFDEYFHGDGICLVEWAERMQDMLPDDHLVITLSHAGEDTRTVSFTPHGGRGDELIKLLAAADNEKMF